VLFHIHSQYAAGANGTVTVLNSERKGSPTGPLNSIGGVATRPSPCQPGQFSLKLNNVPFTGSYWVLALGPKIGGFYQWSVVSDKSGATLFILARDVAKFKRQYDKMVLRLVEKLGFTGFKKPLPSFQGKECIY
jgi:apolipoprotein D and lipocalin family protein